MGRPSKTLLEYKQQAQKLNHQIKQQRLNWLNREFPEYRAAMSMAHTKDEKKLVRESFKQVLPEAWQKAPTIHTDKSWTESQQIAQYRKDIAKMERFKDRYDYNPKTFYEQERKMMEKIGATYEEEKIGKRKTRPKYTVLNDKGEQKTVQRQVVTKLLNQWHKICESKDYKYNPEVYYHIAEYAVMDDVRNMTPDEMLQFLYDEMEKKHNKLKGAYNNENNTEDGGDIEFPF